MRIYTDGVFDMFHRGHLECFKTIKKLYPDCHLVVGVVSDKDTESYKRIPIINENDRLEIIKSIKYVDEVVFPGPLYMTRQFIEKHNIDLIVHGFANPADINTKQKFFAIPMELGKFKEIPYYSKISTTDIIKKVKDL